MRAILSRPVTPADVTAALNRIAAVADPDDVNCVRRNWHGCASCWMRARMTTRITARGRFGSAKGARCHDWHCVNYGKDYLC